MKVPKLYRRLGSGHQFGFATGGWNTLYLAPDHLLLRTSNRFAETYRRFYFGDIEAITICQTIRGIMWNFVWGFALFMAIMFLIYRAGWVSVIFVSVFFALLFINLARGTTCQTLLQTRVQTRPLPLRRVKKALKVMSVLEKQIAAAQTAITPSAAPPEVARALPPPLTSSSAMPPLLPGEVVVSHRSWVHVVTFGVLLLGGILSLWESLAHRPVLMYCTYAAIVLNLGWGIAALVQQRRLRLPKRVIPLAWIDVTGHALGVPIVFMSFTMVYAFQEAKISQATGHGPRPAQLGLTALHALPGFHYVLLVYGVICLFLGLAGFLLSLGRPNHPPGALTP